MPNEEKIICQCPACNKHYKVLASLAGKTAPCSQCSTTFTIIQAPDAPVPAKPPTSDDAKHQVDTEVCTVCQEAVGDDEPEHLCPSCGAKYHLECWEFNEGCGLYGCGSAPETIKLSELEIPAAFWGNEDKHCPNCNNVILAAAVRCKFCGSTFKSARPESTHKFRTRQAQEGSLSNVQRNGILLLIFSLLPCTAPLAGLVGLIWFCLHRQLISKMSGMHSALYKIAIAVAWLQTILIVLFMIIHSLKN